MVSYVLNAVNMTSLVVNSIVLLALVKMKHRQEWPREAYNFFALFSCLLGNIVCLDTQKIIMRLKFLISVLIKVTLKSPGSNSLTILTAVMLFFINVRF